MQMELKQERAHPDFVELPLYSSSMWTEAATSWRTTPSSDARNLIQLCIDGTQPDLSGRIFTMYGDDAIAFSDTGTLLRWVDSFLDQLDYPMSDTKRRKFRRYIENPRMELIGEDRVPQNELSGERGKKGTFLIKVQSRKKSTWQGSIQWVEGKRQQSFQTVLELLRLMDSTFYTRERQPEPMERSELLKYEPKEQTCGRGSFLVRVQYQQNSTWQGTVQWVEGGQKKPFRSALELLLLVDSAFHAQEEECLEEDRMCN